MAPLPDPFRLVILKRITAALGEINGEDGGYHNDMRPFPATKPDGTEFMQDRVFRGRVIFGEDDPLPMISLLEVVLPPDQYPSSAPNPNRHGPWDLMIQGFVYDDPENPTDPAQYLLADVTKRLAQEMPKVYDDDGGIFGFRAITKLTLGVGVVRPPDEISAKAYFWLPITLDLVEDLSNPYDYGNSVI